jgi:hypothetical protein
MSLIFCSIPDILNNYYTNILAKSNNFLTSSPEPAWSDISPPDNLFGQGSPPKAGNGRDQGGCFLKYKGYCFTLSLSPHPSREREFPFPSLDAQTGTSVGGNKREGESAFVHARSPDLVENECLEVPLPVGSGDPTSTENSPVIARSEATKQSPAIGTENRDCFATPCTKRCRALLAMTVIITFMRGWKPRLPDFPSQDGRVIQEWYRGLRASE